MELKKSNKIYGDYYIGLDIGTNSVGIAAMDQNYNLIKYKGEPVWCSHLFEEGHQCADRRGFRTARRRLDRRQQRVQLIDELFASEVGKVDKNFIFGKKKVRCGERTRLIAVQEICILMMKIIKM